MPGTRGTCPLFRRLSAGMAMCIHCAFWRAAVLIAAWGLLKTNPLVAQTAALRFERLSVEQGLSNRTVTAITQDKTGFLWIGTEDGLNRFDGYQFVVYRHNPFDRTTLPDHLVTCLYDDGEGRLWIGTGMGLSCYDARRGVFENYRHDPLEPATLGGDRIWAISGSADGRLWIGHEAGLDELDGAAGRFRHHRHDPGNPRSLPPGGIVALGETAAGVLWLAGSHGEIGKYDPRTGVFVRYDLQPVAGTAATQRPALLVDHRGEVWISQGKHLLSVAPGESAFRPAGALPLSSNSAISVLYEDRRGILWAGTSGEGLLRFDPATASWSQVRPAAGSPHGLPAGPITALFQDRSGVMWVGTARAGLSRHNHKQDVFANVATPDEVRALSADASHTIWVGTARSGVIRYAANGRPLQTLRYRPGSQNSLAENEVLAILAGRGGTVWIGTSRGLYRYDPLKGRLHRLAPSEGLAGGGQFGVNCLLEGRDGTIWAGTTNGNLIRLAPDARPDGIAVAATFGNEIRALSAGRNGELWLATYGGGVVRFTESAGAWQAFRHDPDQIDSASSNFLLSILADSSGAVWLGTNGDGLDRLDPATGRCNHYTIAEGLPSNFITSLVADLHGDIWVATDMGIARLPAGEGAGQPAANFQKYTVNDGLISNEFSAGASYRDGDGNLYFGGPDGFSTVNPESILRNGFRPPVVLTGFRVFDQPMNLPPPLSALQTIRLSWKQNFFSFEFAALDFTAPHKNQFAYRLEGFDDDWIAAGARHFASYTDVDPGKYVFQVRGSNSDGLWNDEPLSVRVVITPPFWRSTWFEIAVFITLGVFVFGLLQFRINKLLEMERLRTRLAADLHDEIAGNLSSIAMFAKIIQDEGGKTAEPELAESHLLQRIMDLSNDSVSAIRDIIWALDPQPETIHDLLLRLHDYAVALCRSSGIELDFRHPGAEKLPAKNLAADQRKHLWLLLKEALLNAVKHSGARRLHFLASYTRGRMQFVVRDDGNGIQPENTSTGKGIRTMKSRAAQLRGKFEITSGPGAGTSVSLQLKI